MMFTPPRRKTEVLKPVNFMGKAKVRVHLLKENSIVTCRHDIEEANVDQVYFPGGKKKEKFVARCGARTHDPEIKSLMLYRLS